MSEQALLEADEGVGLERHEQAAAKAGVRRPWARLERALCGCSILGNVALAVALVIWAKESEDYAPLPPPPANSSSGACPFSDHLSGAVGASDDGAGLAVTGVGADFVSLCWPAGAPGDRSAAPGAYEVRLDDWWTQSRAQVVYRGRSTHANLTDLLPATTYRVAVSTAGAKGVAREVTTFDRGYCGNAADVAAYRRTKRTMKRDIQLCMIKHVASDEQTQKCISKAVGLSAPCARCWVAEAHCTIKECFTPCLSPDSEACQDCSEQRCFPDCVRCSGMPRWSFPP